MQQFNGLQNTGGQAIQSLQSGTLNWDHYDKSTHLPESICIQLFAHTAKDCFIQLGFFVWLISLINLQNQICLQLFKLSPVSLSE